MGGAETRGPAEVSGGVCGGCGGQAEVWRLQPGPGGRDRNHQPAGDHRGVGPPHGEGALPGRGVVRRQERGGGPQAAREGRAGLPAGEVRAAPRHLLLRHQALLAAGERPGGGPGNGGGEADVRDGGLLAGLEPHGGPPGRATSD